MEPRVQNLRQQSLDCEVTLNIERAKLLTEYYMGLETENSIPLQRAQAFKYLLINKGIEIFPGELIVGERGPYPKATPTYPEICCHTIEDLNVLNQREKIPYRVSHDLKRIYEKEIIPFWKGRTLREKLFREMTTEWKDAYQAGVFTEFMEQRAPGHTVLDDKIYRYGMLDFIEMIEGSLAKLNFYEDASAYEKKQELEAMKICAQALIIFANKYAQKAIQLAGVEDDEKRKAELEQIAAICSHVPAHAPRTFHEALQYYWFVHLGVITELNTWDAFNPGRLDQHLISFYESGLQDGSLTKERARELLQCFWIKFNNQPAPPKVGVTAEESGTYTDFVNINTGGLKEDGSDGVNQVTYLILDVIEEMRLLQPSSNIQVSKKNPDHFIKRAARIIRTGFGQPSAFNADQVIQELLRQGKTIEDARQGGTSGCVEAGAFGKENYNLTGYFNLPKILEITLNNGLDPRTGKQIGLKTGEVQTFQSYEQLWQAFVAQLNRFINIKVRGNQVVERLYATYLPVPFLSLLIDDCISTGLDYHNGGARYNTSYIQGVGIGSITDALAAIKTLVFEEQRFNLQELMQALANDFVGHEKNRQFMLNKAPKYGNDDDRADDLMKQVFNEFYDSVQGRKNTKGGTYQINMLPTTVHVYFGSVIGAMPDGRKAGEPLSEGISPVQGKDQMGPTAVVNSAAKMDHSRTGGTLLNQKFTPQLLAHDNGLDQMVNLIRSYFKMDGHHIQFNVVDAETLRKAQQEPEKHRDLIVRVAGYSDYFCDLGKALQDEIIARTAHESF
ncbi:MAG: glycyl radical protein [Anaerolineaceae bacterium]|nr:glycyl radical protein [Anaerolineaceae bacterium]